MYVIPVEFDLLDSDADAVKKKVRKYLGRMLVKKKITKELDDFEHGHFVYYFKCKTIRQVKHLSIVLAMLHNITKEALKNKQVRWSAGRVGFSTPELDAALNKVEEGQDIRTKKIIPFAEWELIKDEITLDNRGYEHENK